MKVNKISERELNKKALQWFSELSNDQAQELIVAAFMKEFAINKNQISWEGL